MCVSEIKAFTLVEVLIALTITVISLVPLLHLLVTSISMMDTAGCLSRATLIGKAKLAEVIAQGYPEIGTDNGNFENEGNEVIFEWQVSVTDALAKELEEIGLTGLRRVNVAVTWREGLGQKQVSLSTYVSIDQVVTMTALEGKSTPQQ
ncbi:MAG: prepilin-type N-terminal cleavage/methylation domain-containing protein [Phycisphaerae bacterium]|nr:prepilin-type N-terminal cleavage/methylation domain-containing protein [Phycisphaerae bacterium]